MPRLGSGWRRGPRRGWMSLGDGSGLHIDRGGGDMTALSKFAVHSHSANYPLINRIKILEVEFMWISH